jgi:hypothetical protein
MARTPETVSISLHELMVLLNFKWAAVSSSDVGELGDTVYEDLLSQLNSQCKIEIKPKQLDDLIFHMKEVIFERVKPARMEFSHKNHNRFMRRLKAQAPHLFKELPSGEVVMINYEDRD